MISMLLLAMLVLLLYQFASALWTFDGGFAAFGAAQWVQLVLCILFIPVIIILGLRARKETQKNKEKQTEEMEKQARELSLRRRAKYLMDRDGFDETYTDLDAPVISTEEAEDDFDVMDMDIAFDSTGVYFPSSLDSSDTPQVSLENPSSPKKDSLDK